jgi:hypothetical protein
VSRVYSTVLFAIPRHYFTYALSIYISFFKYIYKIDSRVSRLRNFLLTGTLPYKGFTFDSPEGPLFATPRHYYTITACYIYIIDSLFDIYISFDSSFAHFLPELIYYLSPKAQPTFFFGNTIHAACFCTELFFSLLILLG